MSLTEEVPNSRSRNETSLSWGRVQWIVYREFILPRVLVELSKDERGQRLFGMPILHEQYFSYLAAVTVTGLQIVYLDSCLALMAFSSEGPFTYHTNQLR
jgi:hypothetical protein